ncbi:pectin esterase [Neiella sp. HB171785]|uniref:Pectin esterase n=2 Tax=Neiella litorisoli TaxID=2771431 RepID=A0A8J6QQ06_9GAMM|nr:pectin esterase [Neiella litorisoli]
MIMSSPLVGATPAEQSGSYLVSKQCGTQQHCFNTIQAAFDAAQQATASGWRTIEVAAGHYYEKVTIAGSQIRLVGQGPQLTRLHFDEVAETAGKYHRDNWGTAGSATLTINADLVAIEGLTIANDFDYLSNDALPKDSPQRVRHMQAAAVLLDIASDRVEFSNVSLEAYQDTLFANGKRAYFRHSKIAGNVDFIFGNGQLLIEDSIIESRRRGKTFDAGVIQSYISAPSTQLANPIGIVVHRSQLTREAGLPDHSVTLGRPWHPTTNFADGRYADPNAVGQVSFIDCFMDSHIHPSHWSSMKGTARDGTKTAVFTPQQSRFYEQGSYGPGATRDDIGLSWQPSLSIEQIHDYLFTDWQAFNRP